MRCRSNYGALALFPAPAALSLMFYQAAKRWWLVKRNTFVNFAEIRSFAVGGLQLIMSEGFLESAMIRSVHEYVLLTLFASLGMGMILSALTCGPFIWGIETAHLSAYVWRRSIGIQARSSEAGLKLFGSGHCVPAFCCLRASLVYGFSGTTNLPGFQLGPVNCLMFEHGPDDCRTAFKISARTHCTSGRRTFMKAHRLRWVLSLLSARKCLDGGSRERDVHGLWRRDGPLAADRRYIAGLVDDHRLIWRADTDPY